jgi:hypothetical protein
MIETITWYRKAFFVNFVSIWQFIRCEKLFSEMSNFKWRSGTPLLMSTCRGVWESQTEIKRDIERVLNNSVSQ